MLGTWILLAKTMIASLCIMRLQQWCAWQQESGVTPSRFAVVQTRNPWLPPLCPMLVNRALPRLPEHKPECPLLALFLLLHLFLLSSLFPHSTGALKGCVCHAEMMSMDILAVPDS